MGRMTLCLAAFGFMSCLTGCSTPMVPYDNSTSLDDSWEAYQDCLNSLQPGQSTNICDNVGAGSATTQSSTLASGQYVDGYGNVQTTTGTASGGSGPSTTSGAYGRRQDDAEFAILYKAYLGQLDAQVRADMTQQWRAIAASVQQK